jgi:hypothetical protein
MEQADQTPSRAIPRHLRCPICPPRHGGDLEVYAVDVDNFDTPRRIRLEHSCRRCHHIFTLVYRLGPEDRWEFVLERGMCPPECTVVHGLYAEP